MEPVEIEIKMDQNVSEESEKATAGMDEMTQAFIDLEKALANPKQALKQINVEIIDQKKLVADLKGQIASLMTESAKGNKEATASLVALKQEYDDETTTLEGLMQLQKAVAAEMATTSARATQLKNEMAALRMENKQDTEQYAMLREEYEKLIKAQSEVKNEASMRAATEGLIQGMSGLSGAVSAGAGAMALFGSKSKEMEAVQTRLQSLIAITVGLQQASNALNERSAFMTNTVTKAKRLWASAVQFLNVQLGITNTLSKVLVAGGIGAIIAAVGLLVVKLREWNKEQAETARLNKIVADSLRSASLEGIKSAQKEITSIDLLYKATQDVTKSMDERLKAAQELQREYPSYFGNMTTEEILAGKASTAYENLTISILKVAKARAANEKITENERKISDLTDSLTDIDNLPQKYRGTGRLRNRTFDVGSLIQQFGRSKTPDDLLKEGLIQLNKDWENYVTPIQKEIDKLNEANQKLIKRIDIRDLVSPVSKLEKETKPKEQTVTLEDTLEAERKSILEQLALWERYFKYIENGYSDLADDLLSELQKGGINLEDYLANQKAKITGQMVDIETVLSGGVSDENRKELEAELAKLGDSLDIVIDAEIKLSYDQTKEAHERKKMLDGILAEYASYTEKRIAIDQKYAALRKTLEENTSINNKPGEMAKLTKSYQDEVDALSMTALKGEDAFAKLGSNIKKLGKEALKQLAADLNKLKMDQRFAESAEAVKAIDDAIEQVNATIEDQTIDNIEKMRDTLGQVVNVVSDIVSELDSLDGSVAKVITSIGKIGKGFASGGVVGAAAAYISSWASGLNEVISYYKDKGRLEDEERIAKQLALQNYEYRQQIELLDEINRLSGIDRTSAREASIENIAQKEKEILDAIRSQELHVGFKEKNWWKKIWSKDDYSQVLARVFEDMTDDELLTANAQTLADKYNKSVQEALRKGEIDAGKNGFIYSVTATDIEANETLANYLELLKEYQDLMRQLQDEQFQDTYGFGYSDLLNDFMNTLSDSEDDLEKWGKSFEDVWKKYILNTIKRTIAEDYINQLVEQIKKANEDGTITSEEYDELKRFWEIQGKRAEAEMRTLEQIYGLQDDIESVREGMKGSALARASQESIDELTGGVYAVRMATADIRNYAREQLMALQTMASQLDVIAQYCEYLERLDAMQRDIEDIKIKGIKVKM